MNVLLHNKLDQIGELCQRHRVKSLEVFGSAAGDDFDLQRSDVDFLVEFLPLDEGQYADTYFGLLEGLERLLERPVDLVMTSAIRNRYFLESAEKTRTPIYAD
ncbi:MAG: nucleotidyltransferase domain-containing protein [Candidatus Hydrogenedentes bacterium]|nr:nucleotidyltransferase domain-containing protein [Candidatus Hydrogenedentota bacterium]